MRLLDDFVADVRFTLYTTVVNSALKPVVIGLAGGAAIAIPTAIAFARILVQMRLGATASDPRIYASAGMCLIAIILVALYVPARRAARVDPMLALRGVGLPPSSVRAEQVSNACTNR